MRNVDDATDFFVNASHAARCTARHGLSSVANASALSFRSLWNLASHPSPLIFVRTSERPCRSHSTVKPTVVGVWGLIGAVAEPECRERLT
jgi:hypothetical protein